MSNELVVKEEDYNLLADFDYVHNATQKLLTSKHYATLGQEGVFAIVQTARSLNINPVLALNGALSYQRGKVGMSAELMSALIRSKGHSLIVDAKSNDNMCILHGKRADNGDTCTVSFSIEDAKRAGIYANSWLKYPGDMCYNRCVSKIKRRLFSDIGMNMYENDEVRDFQDDDKPSKPINYVRTEPATIEVQVEQDLPKEAIQEFYSTFNDDEELTRSYVNMCMTKKGWSESRVIKELRVDLVASHKTYASWKKKQKPKEVEVIEVKDPEVQMTHFDAADAFLAHEKEGK